jgi:preprotein translocase subunit SecG
MQTVLIVIHLMIVLALVGIVLVQRSEGGGLGIGGGSGFMSARGAANALTRTTGILAAAFFVTSLALGILARYGDSPTDIIDQIPARLRAPARAYSTSSAARRHRRHPPQTRRLRCRRRHPGSTCASGSDVPTGTVRPRIPDSINRRPARQDLRRLFLW